MGNKSVKELCNTVIGKITIVIMAIFMFISIVPSLLNARSNIAVLLGIVSIMATAALLFVYHKKILIWLGITHPFDDH